jgi:hypothetical protein
VLDPGVALKGGIGSGEGDLMVQGWGGMLSLPGGSNARLVEFEVIS